MNAFRISDFHLKCYREEFTIRNEEKNLLIRLEVLNFIDDLNSENTNFVVCRSGRSKVCNRSSLCSWDICL